MDREMQASLLSLCALDRVNWHVIAREAQQPRGLERLLQGQLTEASKQARETQKLIARAGRDLAEQKLRAVDEISRAEGAGAKLVTVLDDDYPANLRVIYNLPPFLFYRGRLVVLR
jgi:DNA processing protein